MRMYDMGLIYRDTRCIHWSCSLQSAISDIEVSDHPSHSNRSVRHGRCYVVQALQPGYQFNLRWIG